MKFIMSHRFWAVMFWVNAICLATADYAWIGLMNAVACLLCIHNFNLFKPK